eukprot:2868815-Rhodomonas_salina.1
MVVPPAALIHSLLVPALAQYNAQCRAVARTTLYAKASRVRAMLVPGSYSSESDADIQLPLPSVRHAWYFPMLSTARSGPDLANALARTSPSDVRVWCASRGQGYAGMLPTAYPPTRTAIAYGAMRCALLT